MNRIDARTAANRENARKSTGPKTDEGKARSRTNAFQHGLAGQGVAWPDEEQAQVDEFVKAQVEVERPQDPREVFLAARAAATAWQILRADRIEAANAHARFASGQTLERRRRDQELDALIAHLYVDPQRAMRAILRTKEGCEWALAILREFHAGAEFNDPILDALNGRLNALTLPAQPGLSMISRARQLVHALNWRMLALWPEGLPGLEPLPENASKLQKDAYADRERAIYNEHRQAWIAELRAILARRIEEVESLLASLQAEPDPAMELAGLIASFDDTPYGERLRRYQRANLRERRLALEELDAWRASRPERESLPEVRIEIPPRPESTSQVAPSPPPEEPGEPSPPAEPTQSNDHTQIIDKLELAKQWLRSAPEPEPPGRVSGPINPMPPMRGYS